MIMEESSLFDLSLQSSNCYSNSSNESTVHSDNKEAKKDSLSAYNKPSSTGLIVGDDSKDLKETESDQSNEEFDQDSMDESADYKITPSLDHRVLAINPKILPYSAQGRIEIISNGVKTWGSGTLISSKHVLTAASHLYYDKITIRQLHEKFELEDHREVVIDTTIYPYSAQGRLVMYFSGKAVYGSGTLIGSKYVLTAAQNLYHRYLNKEPDSILFIPALNGSRLPYGLIGVRRYFYPVEFKDTRLEDYALLELEDDIGEVTGFLEMRSHKADEIDGKECSLYGYPGYVNEEKNNYLYGMSGIVSYIESKGELKYNIEAGPGVGGASIYYKSPEDGKYYTIGVHVKRYIREGYNSGVYLTPERIERIREWMQSYSIHTKHNLQTLTSEVYGRKNELNILREYMRNQPRFGVLALSGIAGVGKSTIALKFAMKCIGSYDYIWWINAETKESFVNSVLALAETLQIKGKSYQEKLNMLKVLLNSKDIHFLLILDNLEDEVIAREIITIKGHFIITTRLNIIDFEKIEVSPLSRVASVQLLHSKLNDNTNDLETLADFLEDLPLALVQAASYIRESRLEISDYIQSFSSLLDIDSRLKNITSQNIDSFCEESKHIISIVCLGHNDNIPYDMLYKVFRYKYPDTEEFDFNYYLVETLKFNILSYDTKKDLLKIHRVIQEISNLKLSPYICDELKQHYTDYLYYNYNPQADISTKEESEKIKYLTLHVEKFLNRCKFENPSTRCLLLYSGIAYSYLHFFLDYNTSNKYIQIVDGSFKETQADLDLATTYSNLGCLYSSIKEYSKSEEYFIKKLSIQEAVLPENHPDLARTYSNLGSLYSSMGDYSKSEEYHLRCLRIQETVLPENHPDLAKTYSNLGSLYYSIGDYSKSEDYYLRCLRIQETVLPETHPDIANTYSNLGCLYSSMGDYSKSKEYHLRCLRIQETVLPETHPDIAKTYSNLGSLYSSIGDYSKSEEYLAKTYGIMEEVDH